jgi:hypothetical protein
MYMGILLLKEFGLIWKDAFVTDFEYLRVNET